MQVVIDSNVVFEILKKKPNPTVLGHASTYLRGGSKFLMTPIVYFECRRGLLTGGRDPDDRASSFDRFVAEQCDWLDLDRSIAQKAAWLWSRFPGNRVPDADMLIAASALYHKIPLATRNRSDFDCYGVEVLNWFEKSPKASRTRQVR